LERLSLTDTVHTFSSGAFELGTDLERLLLVHEAGAVEAVILYGSRIVEGLARAALEMIGQKASNNLCSNLISLQDLGLLRTPHGQWAHTLRRLGNDARHIHRPVSGGEADACLLLVEQWLRWFFEYAQRYGEGVDSADLSASGGSLDLPVPELLSHVIAVIGSEETAAQKYDTLRGDGWAQLVQEPAASSVLAEILLDAEEVRRARKLIDAARALAPDDRRLVQLDALALQAAGDLEAARDLLKPLRKRFKDDAEIVGILAGVIKRLSLEDGGSVELQQEAAKCYRQGFAALDEESPYLGINAAAMSAWTGRPAESRSIARKVLELLASRERALARIVERQGRDGLKPLLQLWDELTYAEGLLLSGRFAEAARRYAQAWSQLGDMKRKKKVSCEQADRSLREGFGLECEIRDLIDRACRAAPERVLRIGVTGSRSLPDEPALSASVSAVLKEIIETGARSGPVRPVVLSPLAEGADRLVAEAILADWPASGLVAYLPLELDDYRGDFESAGYLAHFNRLLSMADRLVFGPDNLDPSSPAALKERRNRAYEWAGRAVVDDCEVLVAIWDGGPGKGRGGTAEIVAYAREKGRRMVCISTKQPFAASFETARPPSAAAREQ